MTTDPGADKAVQALLEIRMMLGDVYMLDPVRVGPILSRVDAALTSALPAQPQSEPTRSQRMAEAGFTRRDTRLECDECGAKVSAQLLPIHKCAAQPPERAALQEAQEVAKRPAFECASQYATKRGLAVTREWVRGWDACTDYVEEVLAASPPRAVEPMPALTDAEVWASEEIMAANSGAGLTMDKLMQVIRAYEAARGIGKRGGANA